jgi:hypothetical protein
VLARQLELQLQLLELALHPVGEALHVVAGVLALGEQLGPDLELLAVAVESVQGLQALLEATALLQDRLAALGVVPEARRLDVGVELG